MELKDGQEMLYSRESITGTSFHLVRDGEDLDILVTYHGKSNADMSVYTDLVTEDDEGLGMRIVDMVVEIYEDGVDKM